eukprot:361390-Chlamydomonas_euryale.AAC.1
MPPRPTSPLANNNCLTKTHQASKLRGLDVLHAIKAFLFKDSAEVFPLIKPHAPAPVVSQDLQAAGQRAHAHTHAPYAQYSLHATGCACGLRSYHWQHACMHAWHACAKLVTLTPLQQPLNLLEQEVEAPMCSDLKGTSMEQHVWVHMAACLSWAALKSASLLAFNARCSRRESG